MAHNHATEYKSNSLSLVWAVYNSPDHISYRIF